MAELVTVAQGLSASFVVTLRGNDGKSFTAANGYTPYGGTEELAGTVRAGRDQVPLLVLAPAWLDAAAATIAVPIAGADTAGLDPGRYVLELHLDDDSADLFEGFLEVTYSAGTAAALASYGSYAQMLDIAPWIEKLQRGTDLAGFARQRYLARRWFEDILHRHYRGSSGIADDVLFLPRDTLRGADGYYLRRDGRRSKELQDLLDADRLDVTDAVVEAVSNYAIALVCDRQVSPTKDDGTYSAAARKYFTRAEEAATNVTAELDSDGDGVNDRVIRLGLADTLEG